MPRALFCVGEAKSGFGAYLEQAWRGESSFLWEIHNAGYSFAAFLFFGRLPLQSAGNSSGQTSSCIGGFELRHAANLSMSRFREQRNRQ